MKKVLLTLALLAFALPARAAITGFEISGWIPYWKISDGTRDAKRHLSELTEINPFGYSVKQDGSLNDLANIKKSDWKNLFSAAKKKNVKIVPTVMWSDAPAMEKILNNADTRAAHVKAVAEMVKEGKYPGVDIDYEGKTAATKDGFSAFLRELKSALGTKTLSCTIEPRTPRDSLYDMVPTTPPQYSNDYSAIAAACDRVIIMAYDQRRADLKLNAANKKVPYVPVADVAWVRKVMTLALESIPAGKLSLGIPTYGQEYQVTTYPSGYQEYVRVGSRNPDEALKIAKQYKVKPVRQPSGELGFTYIPKDSPKNPPNLPAGTKVVNFVTWSDADAVEQKVTLAQQLNLRGVALFKIDGGEDQSLWNNF